LSSVSDIPKDLQKLLRLLTIGDESALDEVLHGSAGAGLDHKTKALVVIAALVATEADGPSYKMAIDRARLAGAADREILETLRAIATLVGAARIASAMDEVVHALAGDGAYRG
jgi:alkylhydroperoxidase/carboxymuconolactone decarboxylase family protein YurZ